VGGTLVLLFWGLSECFNNEAQRDIWNVRTFLSS
jgi:hypothetical protein